MCVRFYGILYYLYGSSGRMFVCVESPYLIDATSSFLERALIFFFFFFCNVRLRLQRIGNGELLTIPFHGLILSVTEA